MIGQKQTMENIGSRLSAIIDTVVPLLGPSEKAEKIASLKKMIDKAVSAEVKVLICGEFKRGKSSFVNALLGDKLCPVDRDICTSAVSVVKYGAVRKVIRSYGELDALQEEIIPFDRLADFSVGDVRQIDNTVMLTIEVPNEKLKNGLVLIDTPGVGGLDMRHGFLTTYFMPQADITLFMTDTGEPMTTTELTFYRQKVQKYSNYKSIILNKIDQVGLSERETLIADTRSKVAKECGVPENQVDVIPISANEGTNIHLVEAKIEQMMQLFRTELLKNVRDQLIAEVVPVVMSLKTQLQQINMPDGNLIAKLSAKRDELNIQIGNLTNPNSAFRTTVQHKIAGIREAVLNHMNEQSIIFSSQALNNLITRMRQEGHDAAWIGTQLQDALQTMGAEITLQLRQAFNEIAEMEEFEGILQSDIQNGNVTIVGDNKLNEDLPLHKLAASMLPGMGAWACVNYTLGALTGGAWIGVVAVGAGIAMALGMGKSTLQAAETKAIIEKYQPQITIAMNNMRTYVETRFAEFQTEYLAVLGQRVEENRNNMTELITKLNSLVHNQRQTAAKKAAIENQLKPLDAQLGFARMILADPLSAARPKVQTSNSDETQF